MLTIFFFFLMIQYQQSKQVRSPLRLGYEGAHNSYCALLPGIKATVRIVEAETEPQQFEAVVSAIVTECLQTRCGYKARQWRRARRSLWWRRSLWHGGVLALTPLNWRASYRTVSHGALLVYEQSQLLSAAAAVRIHIKPNDLTMFKKPSGRAVNAKNLLELLWDAITL